MGPSMTVASGYRIIGGFALLLLCGCEPTHFPVPGHKPAAPAEPAVLTPPNATPAPVQSTKSARKSDDRKEDRKPAPPPPSVELVGLDETGVQTRLGPPAAVEDRPPGKIWRFRNRNCVLSLALYPEVETRAFRVLSYEVTSDEHNAGAKQLCETKFGGAVATE